MRVEMQTTSDHVWEHRHVVLWLGLVTLMVFVMITVGGITRLTDSGLSMVEWRPLMGILPPLTDAEWGRVFDLYRQSPEYQKINAGMTMAEFKWIFFWEYLHRVLGRLIGLAYALPLLVFALRRQLPQGYRWRFLLLLGLGAAQGGIGWWMVKSGLIDNPYVSQYRLATHLGMALTILGVLVWTIADLIYGRAGLPRGHVAGVIGILAITIIAGAFVAGMNAGLIYNEYPLMGGQFIPIEYGFYGAMDAFENPASAQFHHRWLAAIAALGVVSLWFRAKKHSLTVPAFVMLVAVACQFLLGVFTLLYQVPVSLGTWHQAGAAALLITVLWVAHGLTRTSQV
jgi:cytochrome c oxidase assembly protein subunit 15